jgi:hypothetical protein
MRIPKFLQIVTGSEKNSLITRILERYVKNIAWPKDSIDDEEIRTFERVE